MLQEEEEEEGARLVMLINLNYKMDEELVRWALGLMEGRLGEQCLLLVAHNPRRHQPPGSPMELAQSVEACCRRQLKEQVGASIACSACSWKLFLRAYIRCRV